jgi:hypothetical protein
MILLLRFQILKVANKKTFSRMLHRVAWHFTDVSEVLYASSLRRFASTYETSVNYYQTTGCNIPEDSQPS